MQTSTTSKIRKAKLAALRAELATRNYSLTVARIMHELVPNKETRRELCRAAIAVQVTLFRLAMHRQRISQDAS